MSQSIDRILKCLRLGFSNVLSDTELNLSILLENFKVLAANLK